MATTKALIGDEITGNDNSNDNNNISNKKDLQELYVFFKKAYLDLKNILDDINDNTMDTAKNKEVVDDVETNECNYINDYLLKKNIYNTKLVDIWIAKVKDTEELVVIKRINLCPFTKQDNLVMKGSPMKPRSNPYQNNYNIDSDIDSDINSDVDSDIDSDDEYERSSSDESDSDDSDSERTIVNSNSNSSNSYSIGDNSMNNMDDINNMNNSIFTKIDCADTQIENNARNEVEVLKRLNGIPNNQYGSQRHYNNNILEYYRDWICEYTDDDGNNHKYHYIVTEYVGERTLDKMIIKDRKDKYKSTTKKEKAKIFWKALEDILHGLVVIHNEGMIHKDIKPTNIVYDDKRNRYVIIDFGIACLNKDNCTMVDGTRAYNLGRIINTESENNNVQLSIDKSATIYYDIYSLAITLLSVYTRNSATKISTCVNLNDIVNRPGSNIKNLTDSNNENLTNSNNKKPKCKSIVDFIEKISVKKIKDAIYYLFEQVYIGIHSESKLSTDDIRRGILEIKNSKEDSNSILSMRLLFN